MAKTRKAQSIDAGKIESPIVAPNEAWEDADVGEESVGGESPTPGQDIAEELGRAVWLSYEDNEPLHMNEKIAAR